jgi:predicted DNA-binding transcriptional regulator AlpA
MDINELSFLRLPRVLEILPFSRSAWYKGVRDGLYPKPVMLSRRTCAWRVGDIKRLAEELSAGGKTNANEKNNN